MSKIKLHDLTIPELVDYEKAARLICIKYEKAVSAWGADTVRSDYQNTNEFQEQYTKYKAIYDSIIEEIEKKLSEVN